MVCPLDAALSLPARCYSDLLREWMTYGSTDAAYRETQTLLARILGLRLSTQALETAVAEDAGDVAAFWTQPVPARPPTSGATILVAQADGKGVPMVPPTIPQPRAGRRGKGQPPGTKQEAIVTSVYTIAPYRRTPADVLAALLAEPAPAPRAARPRPLGKEVRATLDGKPAALTRLAARGVQHESARIQQRVALTDGAVALQQQMQAHLPGHTLVLDIIHATEHLWEVANAVLGERHPDRTAWVRQRLGWLLTGRAATLIAELDRVAAAPTLTTAQRKVVQQTVGYYQRNLPSMGYDEYLAQGWPIGTGVVEGACGHLVKDRLEQAGMRWTKGGAQAVLDLRAVRLNGQWDAYWHFHRQQHHARHYGAAPIPARVEDQAFRLAA